METPTHGVCWAEVRKRFDLPTDTLYLNSGTWGLSPRCVIETALKYRKLLESNPLRNTAVCADEARNAKRKLAEYVGADPDDLVFMTNTRMALNGIIRGLRGLGAGDEILCTDQEYGAIDNIWRFLASRQGLVIRRIPLPTPPESREQILGLFKQNLSDRTRVVTFCHVTSQTGLVLPVKQLCQLAREHGAISIVDGAHAPGMVPVDLSDMGCDCYAASCHKWLCSAKGAAFAFATQEMRPRLEPFFIEHGWKEESRFPYGYQGCGTEDVSAYISVGAAVDFQHEVGRENIMIRIRQLARYAKERLTAIPGTQLLTPMGEDLSGSMATYAFPDAGLSRLKEAFESEGIIVPLWPFETPSAQSPGSRIRLSTHIYNDEAEIELLADLVEQAVHART